MNSIDTPTGQNDNQAWMCAECGYIYDPVEGDLETNIRPGIPFGKLPQDWCCPVCNREPHHFKPFISQL